MPISNGVKKIIKKLVPDFIISSYHFSLALLGAIFYGFPSRKINIIGVTGTNGKSTVVEMISKILKESGYKVASISSIRFEVGGKEWQNDLKMTMPGRFALQKFLKQALVERCDYAVIEVTSEGIKQYRHKFINFSTAVFTNLTPEHIESHKGFENYKKAKGKLFESAKRVHVINLDDQNAEYFLGFLANEKYGYAIKFQTKKLKDKDRDRNLKLMKAKDCQLSSKRTKFFVDNTEFNLKLLGKFNIYNALASICVGISQGIDLRACKKALEKIEEVPGRLEIIIKKPFDVIVDYAHTPDALQNLYQTALEFKTKKSKMICVLGSCGGGRDKWKRPELGKIASECCDKIILTNEDPYDENPREIIEQIRKGVIEGEELEVFEILDREKAIEKSLRLARPSDTVIVSGKGSESWMCISNGRKIPWDDRKIVREKFKKIFFQSIN